MTVESWSATSVMPSGAGQDPTVTTPWAVHGPGEEHRRDRDDGGEHADRDGALRGGSARQHECGAGAEQRQQDRQRQEALDEPGARVHGGAPDPAPLRCADGPPVRPARSSSVSEVCSQPVVSSSSSSTCSPVARRRCSPTGPRCRR